MPKVSVIIPVYNMEKYIARCLDSVINQTFKDIEIICVDDCTPDNSMEIVKEYANKNNRIKIIKNEKNLKLGKTRETGFFVSDGDFVIFLDADDTIDLDYIEKLYNKAIETGFNVIKANTKIIYNDGRCDILKTNENIQYNLDNNIPLILIGQDAPWSFFIKRNFIIQNKIMPDNLDGDCCIGGRIMYHANKIALVNDTFYNYYYGQTGSFSGQNNNTSYNIRLSIVLSKVKLLNSFNVDKTTYISYIKNHTLAVWGNIKHIYANYDIDETKKIINEFFSMFDLLKLTEQEKQLYLYSLFDKTIAKNIKTKNLQKIITYFEKQSKPSIKEKIKIRLNKIFRCNSIKKRFCK